jgi:hypothetical protein
MNPEFDTLFLIIDKMFDILDYVENKFKRKKRYVEIEMENKTKNILDENYIEKDYTLITFYSKINKKDCM